MSDSIERRVGKLEARAGRREGLPGDRSLWTDAELWAVLLSPEGLQDLKRFDLSQADYQALVEWRWDDVSDEALEIIAQGVDDEES